MKTWKIGAASAILVMVLVGSTAAVAAGPGGLHRCRAEGIRFPRARPVLGRGSVGGTPTATAYGTHGMVSVQMPVEMGPVMSAAGQYMAMRMPTALGSVTTMGLEGAEEDITADRDTAAGNLRDVSDTCGVKRRRTGPLVGTLIRSGVFAWSI